MIEPDDSFPQECNVVLRAGHWAALFRQCLSHRRIEGRRRGMADSSPLPGLILPEWRRERTAPAAGGWRRSPGRGTTHWPPSQRAHKRSAMRPTSSCARTPSLREIKVARLQSTPSAARLRRYCLSVSPALPLGWPIAPAPPAPVETPAGFVKLPAVPPCGPTVKQAASSSKAAAKASAFLCCSPLTRRRADGGLREDCARSRHHRSGCITVAATKTAPSTAVPEHSIHLRHLRHLRINFASRPAIADRRRHPAAPGSRQPAA